MIDWTDWTTGSPPAPGWFNASRERSPELRRHWDGAAWSAPCHEDAPTKECARIRADRDPLPTDGMEWRDLTPGSKQWLADEGCPLDD